MRSCGANADTRLSVRFITEVARQAHCCNMFIRPTDEELVGFKPDFIVKERREVHQPAVERARAESGKLRGVQPD